MLSLQVVSPQKVIFEGEVSEILLPGVDGDFTILEGHAPLLAALRCGTMIFEVDQIATYFVVNKGFCRVRGDSITVLAEHCHALKDLDEEEITASIRELNDTLDGEKEPESRAALKEKIDLSSSFLDAFTYKADEI